MNHCSRIIFTIGLVASVLLGVYPSSDIAFSATVPDVSVLPAITAEIRTPVRLAADPSGNVYVTNPAAGGVFQYNSDGTFVKKIVTSKNGTGVAIAQNGDLLVTQGTYVAAINTATGVEDVAKRLTGFTYANGIVVDPSGNIYVSDGQANNIKGFDVNRNPLWTYSTSLSKPAGLAYDKSRNLLAVANSLSGTVPFLNIVPGTTTPPTLNSTLGAFGYSATHSAVLFTYPQGISFEYDTGGALYRIYVSDSYQSTVQVIDGVTKTWLADIGGYGYSAGKLFTPTDVLVDQLNPDNKRVFVANGGGNLSVFGIDNMQPTNIQVTDPTLASLTVRWVNPAGADFVRIYRSNAAGAVLGLLADNQTGTSYLDTPLAQGTTNYYLVRAVKSSKEYPNTQPRSGTTRKNYDLTLTASGFGTINGTASVGENSTNTTPILDNTLVTLTANPNALKSVFDVWTGACAAFGTNNICQIPMDAAKSVTATFRAQRPFFVDGYYTDTLHDALSTATGSGSIIEVMAGTWPASSFNLATANRPINIIIKGGFDSGFTDPPSAGTTVIYGRVNVQAGKLTVKSPIKIKP